MKMYISYCVWRARRGMRKAKTNKIINEEREQKNSCTCFNVAEQFFFLFSYKIHYFIHPLLWHLCTTQWGYQPLASTAAASTAPHTRRPLMNCAKYESQRYKLASIWHARTIQMPASAARSAWPGDSNEGAGHHPRNPPKIDPTQFRELKSTTKRNVQQKYGILNPSNLSNFRQPQTALSISTSLFLTHSITNSQTIKQRLLFNFFVLSANLHLQSALRWFNSLQSKWSPWGNHSIFWSARNMIWELCAFWTVQGSAGMKSQHKVTEHCLT